MELSFYGVLNKICNVKGKKIEYLTEAGYVEFVLLANLG